MRMISGGSCDYEDWSNGCWRFNKVHFKIYTNRMHFFSFWNIRHICEHKRHCTFQIHFLWASWFGVISHWWHGVTVCRSVSDLSPTVTVTSVIRPVIRPASPQLSVYYYNRHSSQSSLRVCRGPPERHSAVGDHDTHRLTPSQILHI